MQVPAYRPWITTEDKEAVRRALNSGILVRGKETEALESEFAAFIGKKHAVAVSSGTAGLHLSLLATQPHEAGEIVLVPGFTFIADANVPLYERLTPKFIDISAETLNGEAHSWLKASHEEEVALSILPHMYGICAYNPDTLKVFQSIKTPFVEDASQTLLPADAPGNLIGALGRTVVYSLADNKIVTAGQGGIIATDDTLIYKTMMSLRDQGRVTSPDWLEKTLLGYNYKISELNAALARSQLSRARESISRRAHIAARYDERLSEIPSISVPRFKTERSYFNYHIVLNDKMQQERLITRLREEDIATRPASPPAYRFGHIKKCVGAAGACPIAEDMANRIVELPMYPEMTPPEIDHVCKCIEKAAE